MARIRTIKPELLEDERVAALSSHAFRLFIGCILLADDYGNLRAAPGRLAGQVFWRLLERQSVAVADVEGALAELVTEGPKDPKTGQPKPGLLVLYEVRGQIYAHIAGWEKHQRVDRPGAEHAPPPSDPDAEKINGFASVQNIRETHERFCKTLATDPDQDPDQDQDQYQENGAFAPPGSSDPDASEAHADGPLPGASQDQPEPTSAPASPAEGAANPPKPSPQQATLLLEPSLPTPEPPADAIFAHFVAGWRVAVNGKRAPVLNPARRKLVAARLRDGFSLDDLRAAADGIWRSQWHIDNGHATFDFVFRSLANVEKCMNMRASPTSRSTPSVQRGHADHAAWQETSRRLESEWTDDPELAF